MTLSSRRILVGNTAGERFDEAIPYLTTPDGTL
jgi:hypothetical protein